MIFRKMDTFDAHFKKTTGMDQKIDAWSYTGNKEKIERKLCGEERREKSQYAHTREL